VGCVKKTPLNFLQRVVEKLSNALREGRRLKRSKRSACPRLLKSKKKPIGQYDHKGKKRVNNSPVVADQKGS